MMDVVNGRNCFKGIFNQIQIEARRSGLHQNVKGNL